MRRSATDSCTICTWAVPGMCRAKFSVSEMPEMSVPGGRDDVVRLAALDALDQRQPAAARAGALRRHDHVADLVADQRHRPVRQVGDEQLAGRPRGPTSGRRR